MWARIASRRSMGVAVLLASAALSVAAVLAATGSVAGVAGASPAPCTRTAALAYSTGAYAGDKGAIEVANADGTGHHKLLEAATPFLSPNGELIAVTKIGASGGLGIFNLCGARVGTFFSSHDTITQITWSPDSTTLAAVDSPDPNGAPFKAHLEVIDVATERATSVATGFLDAFGGPSFAPGTSHALVYPNSPRTGDATQLYSVTPGAKPTQLTTSGQNQFPVWAKQGVLFQHADDKGTDTLDLLADGHATTLVKTSAWPVAATADGTHLAAENAACGVVWPVTIDLASHRVVHQYPTSFAPYGISAGGGTLLIAGYTPKDDCGGPRTRIETVPFTGGKPTFIAYGTDPSWAVSQAVGVQP